MSENRRNRRNRDNHDNHGDPIVNVIGYTRAEREAARQAAEREVAANALL
jgi:hypothetical protein